MTNPLLSDDPLASLFLPPPAGSAIPLRYRSGLLTEWNVATGENSVSIDGESFDNVPILPGSYLAVLRSGDVVSLMATTDDRGVATYAIIGIAITPPDVRIGRAAQNEGRDWDIQTTSGNVTSTAYTNALSAGLTPSVVVRTMTGKLDIHWSCYLVCGTSLGFAYMSWELREGDTVGAGTVIVAADDGRAIINRDNSAGGGDIQVGSTWPVDELTPGAYYNIQGMYRTSTGTSTFLNRMLMASPRQ